MIKRTGPNRMLKKLTGVVALLLALSVSAFQNDNNNLMGMWRLQQTQESRGVTFNLTGNVLATAPDEDLYGSAGRRYLRFDALATGEQPVPYDAAAAAKLMAEAGLAGIYKGFSPSADCCGLDWTLFLNPDNSARFKSDYLNGEAPLLENGTWQLANNTLTVTLNDAEKPMTFQVADGALISNEFSIFGRIPLRLYRFKVAAPSFP